MEYNDINIELEYEGSGDYTIPVVGVQFKTQVRYTTSHLMI